MIVGNLHLAMDHIATGPAVFVETNLHEWKLMPLAEALRRNAQIIRCCYCQEPAVRLAHHWPYSWSGTMCKEHAEMPHEGWWRGWKTWHYFVNAHSLCWRYETERVIFEASPEGWRCARCAKRAERRLARLARNEVPE